MTAKTKDFQLNEEKIFKNEIINFFNVDADNSSLYIYLEINGKKIKSEKTNKFYKLLLNELKVKNTKKEFNFLILEDVELKILIKIITKYTRYFKKKSKSFYKKPEEKKVNERKNVSPEIKSIKAGMSIKDKIKLFSGELIKKHIYNLNNKLPGKLIMPKIFQMDNDDNKKKIEDKKEDKK